MSNHTLFLGSILKGIVEDAVNYNYYKYKIRELLKESQNKNSLKKMSYYLSMKNQSRKSQEFLSSYKLERFIKKHELPIKASLMYSKYKDLDKNNADYRVKFKIDLREADKKTKYVKKGGKGNGRSNKGEKV